MAGSRMQSDIRILKWLSAAILAVLLVDLGIQAYWIRDHERRNRFDSPWYETAKDLSRGRDWPALLEHAELWLQEDPEEPYALWFRASALYQMGDYAAAAEAFRKARHVAPSWAERIDAHLEICDRELGKKKEENEPKDPPDR